MYIWPSAQFLGFWASSPLSVFGTEIQYRIHATFPTTSPFWQAPPSPLSADVISTSSLNVNYCVHLLCSIPNLQHLFPLSSVVLANFPTSNTLSSLHDLSFTVSPESPTTKSPRGLGIAMTNYLFMERERERESFLWFLGSFTRSSKCRQMCTINLFIPNNNSS